MNKFSQQNDKMLKEKFFKNIDCNVMSRDNFWLSFNVRLDVILQRFVQFTDEM